MILALMILDIDCQSQHCANLGRSVWRQSPHRGLCEGPVLDNEHIWQGDDQAVWSASILMGICSHLKNIYLWIWTISLAETEDVMVSYLLELLQLFWWRTPSTLLAEILRVLIQWQWTTCDTFPWQDDVQRILKRSWCEKSKLKQEVVETLSSQSVSVAGETELVFQVKDPSSTFSTFIFIVTCRESVVYVLKHLLSSSFLLTETLILEVTLK